MAPSILLITGGAEHARDVFREEGRADWAQATPLVLEKLGYLGVQCGSPVLLEDPRTWERHAAVMVPRLPRSAWSARAVELAGTGRAQLLVELPPAELRPRAGISSAEPADLLGTVSPVDRRLRDALERTGQRLTTRLAPPRGRPVDRDPATSWTRLAVPIEPRQAEAWNRPGWDVERWAVEEDVEVLAEWIDDESGRWPAICRRGAITACAFSLLGFLAQQTTVAPFEGAEHVSYGRSRSLDTVLAFLLDDMHRRSKRVRPRVLPWPEGTEWTLNIRHDFDRPRTRAQVGKVLDGHKANGTSATWYWRSRHLKKPGAAAVARRVAATPGHEVALHTEQLWLSAEDELKAIEAAVRRPVRGSSAHGDPSCFRWQGAPNVLWAERHGLDYTEFISHAHLHPHRFAALGSDGAIDLSRVICLPHHESFDRSMEAGDVADEAVVAATEDYIRSGGMMQILSHPDIHVEELFETISRLPRDRRLDWTASEAADWWRRTHVMGELQIDQDEDDAVTVSSTGGVRGAVVELLAPDGERRRFAIHIEAGGAVTIGAGKTTSTATPIASGTRWEKRTASVFAEAARAYYAGHGIDATAPSARSTIAINSELVPNRVAAMRRYLAELGGVTSLQGKRVLDCGTGFGAFAAYLSQERDAPLVTGVDTRRDFAELANRIARDEGLRGFSSQVADMRTLEGLDDGAFDLVVVNNAFIYVTSKEEMRQVVRTLARVTAPGGHVFMFHANNWQLREPFTGDPIMHLLPGPLASATSKVTGWGHSHGRVRLISAPALGRMLRGSGFDRVETGAMKGSRVVRPPRALLARFYAVVARRSG